MNPMIEASKVDANNIRVQYRANIRAFVEQEAGWLKGRVLDFGAGKPGTCLEPQLYRGLVKGEYVPVDKGDTIPPGPYDAVLCTQVLNYVERPVLALAALRSRLRPGGRLVLTYSTTWPFVEECDLWRQTPAGMNNMLWDAGWSFPHGFPHHFPLGTIDMNGFQLVLGYGVVVENR